MSPWHYEAEALAPNSGAPLKLSCDLIHDMALVAFHIVYDHVRPHGQNGRYLDPAHLVLIDDVGREAPKTCPDLMQPEYLPLCL